MKNKRCISFIFMVAMLLSIVPVKTRAQVSQPQTRGVYGLTELHIGYGLQGVVQKNEIGFTGLSALMGYTFTKTLSAGVGAGILAYNGSNAVPVFVEGGYTLKPVGLGKMRFFVKADAGMLLKLNGNVDAARVFASPQAGILIPVAYHKELSLSFGLFSQYEQNKTEAGMPTQLTNFLNAKIGLRFY